MADNPLHEQSPQESQDLATKGLRRNSGGLYPCGDCQEIRLYPAKIVTCHKHHVRLKVRGGKPQKDRRCDRIG
jgi:ribosomal protein L16/L10AE